MQDHTVHALSRAVFERYWSECQRICIPAYAAAELIGANRMQLAAWLDGETPHQLRHFLRMLDATKKMRDIEDWNAPLRRKPAQVREVMRRLCYNQ